jgi:hypothetical protein
VAVTIKNSGRSFFAALSLRKGNANCLWKFYAFNPSWDDEPLNGVVMKESSDAATLNAGQHVSTED